MKLRNGEIKIESINFTPNTGTEIMKSLEESVNIYGKSEIVRCNFIERVKIENKNFWVRCVFKKGIISSIELRNAESYLKNPYDSWEEEKFRLKKESHDDWLIRQIGEPHERRINSIKYTYPWGSILSFFEIKSGDCAIVIDYLH